MASAMEADWEVEVGGGAPVIEAQWPGFIDLRRHPERIAEIQEGTALPALGTLLLALNGAGSPLWTSKCDLWEPQTDDLAGDLSDSPEAEAAQAALPSYLACYIDLLPLAGSVFSQWQQAEAFCRHWITRLIDPLVDNRLPGCRLDMVVRQSLAGEVEGFAVTAYLSAAGRDRAAAAQALAGALAAFAASIPA